MSLLPMEQRHCFCIVQNVCHYCLMTAKDFVNSDQQAPCPRIMEPVPDHQEYLYQIMSRR